MAVSAWLRLAALSGLLLLGLVPFGWPGEQEREERPPRQIETLASGGWDSSVKLWDVASGKERLAFRPTRQVWAVAWSPDGKTLAVGYGDGAIKLWDLVKEEPLPGAKP